MSVGESLGLTLLFNGRLENFTLAGGSLDKSFYHDGLLEALSGTELDRYVSSLSAAGSHLTVLQEELLVESGSRLATEDVLNVLLSDVNLRVEGTC